MAAEETDYKSRIMELIEKATPRQLDLIYRFLRGLLYG